MKDKHTGQLRKRILMDMGVRQGSVYDTATWDVKTAGDRTAITAQQQGIGTEVNVSDLKFMDDVFFLTSETWTHCKGSSNVSPESSLNTASKSKSAKLKRGQLRIHRETLKDALMSWSLRNRRSILALSCMQEPTTWMNYAIE